MKKLAFVINVFREDGFHSGGERVFYELVNRAVEQGCIVDLYCTTYLGNKNNLKAKLNKISFIGHPKDFKNSDKIQNFYDEVKNQVKNENYDRIISENISPPLDIGVLQGHSHKHYSNLCGNIFSRLLYSAKKYKFIKAQEKWLKTPYTKIITPSEALKEELKSNFNLPEEKFAVIYPGVDIQQKSEAAFSKMQDLNDNFIVFGLSAPSFFNKGGFIFIKALNILKKNGYNFKARIIYSKLKTNFGLRFLISFYNLSECVEFLPYQENMKEFYDSIDILAMPSYLETFGLVALEAMAVGKPVVASSFCGAAEILPTEMTFDIEKNPQQNLSEKLIYFIENKERYAEFSEIVFKIAEKHNWKNFCDRFFEVLTEK